MNFVTDIHVILHIGKPIVAIASVLYTQPIGSTGTYWLNKVPLYEYQPPNVRFVGAAKG